jgi:hypothetical protein
VAKGLRELIVTKLPAERIGHLGRDSDHLLFHSNYRDMIWFGHSLEARVCLQASCERQTGALNRVNPCHIRLLHMREKGAPILLHHISRMLIPQSTLPLAQPATRMIEAIGTLSPYSFITPREDERMYDMHRLVRTATRLWAREEGVMVEAQRMALEHLCNIYPQSID